MDSWVCSLCESSLSRTCMICAPSLCKLYVQERSQREMAHGKVKHPPSKKKARFLFLFVGSLHKRVQGNAVFENGRAATRDVATRSTHLASAQLQGFDPQHCKNNKYIKKWLHGGSIIFLGLTCKMGSSLRRNSLLFFSQFLTAICLPAALTLALSSQ